MSAIDISGRKIAMPKRGDLLNVTFRSFVYLEQYDSEITVTVHCSLWGGCVGQRENGTGIKLEPDEPAHAKVMHVVLEDGDTTEYDDLSDYNKNRLQLELSEHIEAN